MEVNWTVITYLVIGLFALSGYFKGWWKEAMTIVFLSFLVFLLQVPRIAQIFIDFINLIWTIIWGILPASVFEFLENLVGTPPELSVSSNAPQLDAGSPQTWLIILIVFIGLAILASRFILPGSGRTTFPYTGYVVTFGGSLLGGLLGALNGWLIISLIRAYLEGHNLPGNDGAEALALSNRVFIRAVNVPASTILDSFLPYLFVGIALVVFLVAVRSRIGIREEDGFRKLEYKAPVGHKKVRIGG